MEATKAQRKTARARAGDLIASLAALQLAHGHVLDYRGTLRDKGRSSDYEVGHGKAVRVLLRSEAIVRYGELEHQLEVCGAHAPEAVTSRPGVECWACLLSDHDYLALLHASPRTHPSLSKAWRGSVTIPAEIQEKIKKMAKAESRSFTKQLEVLLKKHPDLAK